MCSVLERRIVLAGLALAGVGGAAHGAFYIQKNETSSTADNTAIWWDQPSPAGTGAHPTNFNGQQLYTQGYTLRTPNSNYTLGNSSTSLSLDASPGSGELVVRANTASAFSVATVIGNGGRMYAGGADVTMNVGTLNNTNGLRIRPEDFSAPRTFRLNVTSSLTGSGNITFHSTVANNNVGGGGTVYLAVADASDYTGDLTFSGTGVVTVDFNSAFTSDAGIVLTNAASRLVLDQNLTFASVSINGTPLQARAEPYTFSELNTLADTIFVDGGTGTITVVPEPASLSLLLLAGIGVARRRRGRSDA